MDYANSLLDPKLMSGQSTEMTNKYLVLEAISNCFELAGPARKLGWLKTNASFLKILFKVEFRTYDNYYYL